MHKKKDTETTEEAPGGELSVHQEDQRCISPVVNERESIIAWISDECN